ncbi:uncharacterized protein LOC123198688 [Mangifera indica]|uniref:uncharacterized protein LOC123198688 n=1 Tax=Mangifera indica TaxID=29780 RepID=UPI001CFC062C|nr:uncharacterized protein LOC123198688 [Mangifera indica]XP_044469372.1 uncharacterized protein LOC123198688 [Mangifera indica]
MNDVADRLNDVGVDEIVKETQHSCKGFESLGRMTTCGVRRKKKMQRQYMSLLKFQAEIGEIFANHKSLDILISQQPETPTKSLRRMDMCGAKRWKDYSGNSCQPQGPKMRNREEIQMQQREKMDLGCTCQWL